MLGLILSVARAAFIANRGNYDNPEVADAYNMALIFPKNINELTTISPAFILIEAGDIDSAQLSTPTTLNTTPITSIVHQTV